MPMSTQCVLDRIRVLHVGKFYSPHQGGIETYVEQLCRNLPPCFEPSVIAASDTRTSSVCRLAGVPVTRMATLCNVKSNPICPRLSRAIRQSPADIIHIHHPNPGAFLAYLRSGHSGKLIVSYHSDIVRQKLLGRAVSPLLRAVLRRSQVVIVASRQMIGSSTVLAPFSERCQVIPYGIDASRFQRAENGHVGALRSQYGPRIVLAVGRCVYYKGFQYLIAAMARIEATLLLIGDGPLRPALQKQAQEAGLGHRVIFLGSVPDTVDYYHAADVFVLPSTARSEAFGIVQLEAMACGTPVVNTALNSGAPSVSPHGITGLTVAPNDSDALASAINLLLHNPGLRRGFSAAAKARVEEEFTLERMVSRTAELYHNVMGRPVLAKPCTPDTRSCLLRA